MLANSYIYKFIRIISFDNILKYKLNYKRIVVKISDKFYLFETDTKDFSDSEILNIYNKQQIYINLKLLKTSNDFLSDYRKLKKNGDYFEIDKVNLFRKSEIEVKNILNNIFIGDCLDIGCGNSFYKDIFLKDNVNYLGIDIKEINNGLKIIKGDFDNYNTKKKFDILFFFRSINHFSNTEKILIKAKNFLKEKGKIFIVENEAFGEIKFDNQMFNGEKNDYEHFYNYSLENFKKLVNNDYFNIIKEKKIDNRCANQWYILLEKK